MLTTFAPVQIALGLLFTLCAGESEFRYFRCDACSATMHQMRELLKEKTKRRKKPFGAVELALLAEELCTVKTFDKRKYGVKEVGTDAYLFGPGVPSHVPKDVGFGQMGMGDYDHRLASFCRLFVEQFREEELYELFKKDQLLPQTVCARECLSDSSGSVPPRNTDL